MPEHDEEKPVLKAGASKKPTLFRKDDPVAAGDAPDILERVGKLIARYARPKEKSD